MADVAHLWLIRHAPVSGHSGIIHGPDAPADTGDRAALQALRAKLPPKARVFASTARRAVDTAHALGFAPITDDALLEQDFGAWTGRTHDDLQAEFGAAYADFWMTPALSVPPGGESFAQQVARVGTLLVALPAGHNILVAHAGTIRAALSIALELAPEHALRFDVAPLSLTRIDRLEDGWRVLFVNARND